MSININRNANDPFYRYKMPSPLVRLAGKGNGSYIFIDNIEDICKSLNTPLPILMTHISRVLGSNYNEKKNTITGHYTVDEIINTIYNYIDYFILCEKCNIPELTPSIEGEKKNKILNVCCSACGHDYTLTTQNKINLKTLEQIIKHYSVNEYKPSKGTMVTSNFDPFNPLF